MGGYGGQAEPPKSNMESNIFYVCEKDGRVLRQ